MPTGNADQAYARPRCRREDWKTAGPVVASELPCGGASFELEGVPPRLQHTIRAAVSFIPARAGNTARYRLPSRTSAVHPRSRGEHTLMFTHALPYTGSSPLARGTHRFHEHRDQQCRFIPARAGNTCCRRSAHRSSPVHPRSRGEHGRDPGESWLAAGSSPLARGTRDQGDGEDQGLRFIPARAGNTKVVCPVVWLVYGSSPLARGTLRERHRAGPHGRFIPARAGNTTPKCAQMSSTPVHPRSRGEHRQPPSSVGHQYGSSPLARGTPAAIRVDRPDARFIPARAGNTAIPLPPCPWISVHPRSRGEHIAARIPRARSCGSSPLARGTRQRQSGRDRRGRFIPARAGNTRLTAAATAQAAVHPRSRGEHGARREDPRHGVGSSPLARGTPRDAARLQTQRRFIPARAGNTCRRGRRTRFPTVHPRSRGEHVTHAQIAGL